MDYLNFLKELHDTFIDLSKKITFDKKHPRQLFLIALYGTIIELCGGLISLFSNKFYTSVPSLFRSIVEAHVELKNLYSDAEYGYYMELSKNEQWVKVLEEAKKGENPFLNDISKWDKLEDELKKFKQEIKDLRDKGFRLLNVFERFEKAEMGNEYRSLYNFLSCEAHSNIRALINRHVDIKENDFEVVFYKDEPLENNFSYLDSTAGILVDSSGMVHEIFKTGQETVVKEYDVKLRELRKKVLD